MDCYGNFRLVVDGKVGLPALYDSMAVVTTAAGDMYLGLSQYHGDAMGEKVFKLVPVETTLEGAPVCNFFDQDLPCDHKGGVLLEEGRP